ncbi:hypothetical protein BC941DRAFT_471503 [Chlamydoabsidia padenii]|nr:hypothetical protein BC941DRAFT_471503 [Chlamydoabsidia padenii]
MTLNNDTILPRDTIVEVVVPLNGNSTLSDRPSIGFGFRSTDFIYLLRLLHEITGLTYIQLCFGQEPRIYSRNFGYLGYVHSLITDPGFVHFFGTTGFTSSKIGRSAEQLMNRFLPSNIDNEANFAILLLYLLEADGTYFARNRGLLDWTQRGVAYYSGGTSTISRSRPDLTNNCLSTKKQICSRRHPGSPENV